MDLTENPPPRDLDIRAIAAVLRRQMRVIVATALVFFGLAAVFLVAVKETYTATALIVVDPDQKNILETSARFPSSAGRENARIDSEVEILRSDAVALAVIDRKNLVSDPEFGPRPGVFARLAQAVGMANAAPAEREKSVARTLAAFKNATQVRRKGLTYLISVASTSRSPQKAADLANTTARAYIDQQVDAKVSATLAARDVLQDQIDQARQALAGYESRIDEYIANNLGALKSSSAAGDIDDLRNQLETARTEIQQTRAARDMALRQLQQEDWAALAQSIGDDSLRQIEARRKEILDRLATQGATRTDSAEALDFNAQLARMDAELANRTRAGLRQFDSRLEQLDRQAAGLRAGIRRSVLSSDLSPEVLTGIYALQQETSIARAQYQNLLSRMRDLETQARIQIADSRIVSPAIAPVEPSFPNRNLVLLAALAASLGFGVSLAFLKEYYIGGITSPTQLSELLQTPVVGIVPSVEDAPTDRLSHAEKIIDAPLSVYAESIRKLRATIDQGFRAGTGPAGAGQIAQGKVILITSSLPDEGKTTTALALARTYAISGRKTLLIDADLRKPSLHRHLGYEPQTGFLDYLRNGDNDELRGTFYARDPASPLALIMGAARSELPTDQLLTSARFETLLQQAREVYDVIIIDTPPLLPVVDARYVAHYADAVVVLVKWAATSQSDLRAAIQPLAGAMKSGAALLPVLGQVPERRHQPDYGYSGYGPGYSAGT